jgi:DNA-directed RNA polymerase subunit E'/Rpb7
MQYTAVFEEQVALTPRDMRKKIESIDKLLESKLRAQLSNKCSKHGFVLDDTLRILSRSMGALEKGRFTGNLLFHVQAEAEVLNPPEGTVLEGEVTRKNKMGAYVTYENAVRVIVPRDLHIGNEAFEAVTVGERVRVQIKKSRFQVNDPFILSVGIFLESLGKAEGAPAAAAAAAPKTAVAPAALPEEEDEGEEEVDPYADLPPLEPATPEPAARKPAESAVFEMENVD